MAAMAAVEAPVSHMAYKRGREDDQLQENEDNQQKRPRHSLLTEFMFEEDIDSLDTVQDERVLLVMKSFEEEISTSPEISTDKDGGQKLEGSAASYDYLASATDGELGIPTSPPEPLAGNDGQHISQNLWNDLFENSSDQKVNLLQPFLSYCYSSNYREFEVYGSDILDPDGQDWFEDEASTESMLNDCIALF